MGGNSSKKIKNTCISKIQDENLGFVEQCNGFIWLYRYESVNKSKYIFLQVVNYGITLEHKIKDLSIRSFEFIKCKYINDCDINASLNILEEVQKQQ